MNNNGSGGSVTFTFSRPVKDVTFVVNGVPPGNSNVIKVTASNAGASVSPTLWSGQACFLQPTVSGNQVNANGHVRVTGVYYTSLTISHTGAQTGIDSNMNVILCGASAQ
ncbi:hypothetical protein [Chryseobacterium wanjuense]